jgi:O-methyltransferase
MYSGRELIKKTVASLGVEIMSRKGRRDIESGHLSAVDEYLRLLTKDRAVALPADPNRNRLLARLIGAGVGEGAHLVTCLHEVLTLDGDVCECGVGSGATSALLANELRGTGKRLWLYDTFAGLPAPTAEDRLIDDVDGLGSMAAYQGKMSHAWTEVQRRLQSIGIPEQSYVQVAGLFEESVASKRLPQRVCFAYVDFDFYAPIKLALETLTERLAPGGMIIVDDYGYFSEGAQIAVDQFMAGASGRFSIEIPSYCHDHFAILRHVG